MKYNHKHSFQYCSFQGSDNSLSLARIHSDKDEDLMALESPEVKKFNNPLYNVKDGYDNLDDDWNLLAKLVMNELNLISKLVMNELNLIDKLVMNELSLISTLVTN